MARLATYKFLVSVDAVVGLELHATTLGDKNYATVRQNVVLLRRWQRPESLVTDITGVKPLSCVLCPPTRIPSTNNMNALTKIFSTPAGPGASR